MRVSELTPLVALTGAGVSAESGIPTFRGSEGLWETHRAEDLATPQAFRRDPHLVWRFYKWRRNLISNSRPNLAHVTLAEIERAVTNFTLITQNVDGLHRQAGSQNVIEIHGSLWDLRCTRCHERWEDRSEIRIDPLPHCPSCSSLARPDVVWFGESLDQDRLSAAMQAAASARAMLIIGTSAVVYPASQLPHVAKSNQANLVEINPEETPLSPYVDECLRGPATVELPRWWDRVRPEP